MKKLTWVPGTHASLDHRVPRIWEEWGRSADHAEPQTVEHSEKSIDAHVIGDGLHSVLLVGVSAIYFSERRHDPTPVSANAVVEVAADAQRDLSRVPMRLMRLSDDQEITVGNELAEQYSINSAKMSPEEVALDRYIRQVGSTVASHAHRHLPYSFHLLPNRP